MVLELGICVFVCISAASLCAFESIFMCIWGRFRGHFMASVEGFRNTAHQDHIKLKNNSCICDLKCGQITLQHFFNLRFISTPPFFNRFVFD